MYSAAQLYKRRLVNSNGRAGGMAKRWSRDCGGR